MSTLTITIGDTTSHSAVLAVTNLDGSTRLLAQPHHRVFLGQSRRSSAWTRIRACSVPRPVAGVANIHRHGNLEGHSPIRTPAQSR